MPFKLILFILIIELNSPVYLLIFLSQSLKMSVVKVFVILFLLLILYYYVYNNYYYVGLGFAYATKELVGRLINFDYCIRQQVLLSLEGYVQITVHEVPTFGVNKVLGSVKVEISRFVAGVKELVHLTIGEKEVDVEVEFHLYKQSN
jgi:hypothetical protein